MIGDPRVHDYRMRRPLVLAMFVLALAGCGGKQAAPPPPPPPTTAPAAPTLTSVSDRAECAALETKIRAVSQLVSASVELMTQSVHPPELARRTGDTQRNLIYAATVIELMRVPDPLTSSRRRLVLGLRRFAGDFGRAKRSVEHGDIATAAQQLVDRPALTEVSAAAKKIDRACRA
jgi:predicted small lipoprotein YifL